LIDPTDAVLLLLDHQTGLFPCVKDVGIDELRANTAALAGLATRIKTPLITTASFPEGPRGRLMPEIHQFAPRAIHVPRAGESNAWDSERFVESVNKTGRKTLIMAGIYAGVSVMLAALDAKAAGFRVYAVMDASGDPSEAASRITLARFSQAGVIPTTTRALMSELQRT
jgi:nicotinamidase-related amidase